MATDQASGGAQPALSRMGFNGHLRERPQGWYHLGHGHRVYSPLLMRFHCPDRLSPFGAGGLNAYAYCLGDPVNKRDPTGRVTEDIHIANLVISALSIGYGAMVFLVPPLARLARPGSYVHDWASMGPPLSTAPGGLDAASTIAGMFAGAVGAVATKLSMDDPESALAIDLTHISTYLTGVVLVSGRLLVGVTPSKDFTSERWRTLGKFVHGRKKIERNEQPQQRRSSLQRPMSEREIREQQFPHQTPAPLEMQPPSRDLRFDRFAQVRRPVQRRWRAGA